MIGSFVADAATMSLHWIYSASKIKQLVADGQPEFFARPSSPFYTYELGDLSPYGEEAFLLLRSVVEHGRVHVRTCALLSRAVCSLCVCLPCRQQPS